MTESGVEYLIAAVVIFFLGYALGLKAGLLIGRL